MSAERVLLRRAFGITKQPSNVLASESETAEFQCAAEGFALPQIRWLKLQSTLPKSRVTMSKNNSLAITNVDHQDAERYICLAENIFNVAKSYATLTIQGWRSIIYLLIQAQKLIYYLS